MAFVIGLSVLAMIRDRSFLSSPYFWSMPISILGIILLVWKDRLRHKWARSEYSEVIGVWFVPLLLIAVFVLIVLYMGIEGRS
jgi:hypothetical protein